MLSLSPKLLWQKLYWITISLQFRGMSCWGPIFPNLRCIHLPRTYHKHLQIVVDTIIKYEKEGNTFSLESLRQMYLDCYHFSDQNVRVTFSFLKLLKKVHTMNIVNMMSDSYFEHPDLLYALITNRAGRNLLESHGNDGDSANSSLKSGNNKSCLPSSVWPILLERA